MGSEDPAAAVMPAPPPPSAPVIPGMAEASIRAAIAQLEALLPERAITVRDLWDRYATSLPAEKWAASVISTVKPFIAMHGDVQAATLSPRHWDDYLSSPGIRERYSVNSRNQQLFRIRVCLNWAVTTERLPFNPLARVRPERAKPKRETVVTLDDEAKILPRFSPVMRAIYLVSIDTAMRKTEVRLLQWSEVDLKSRTITLAAARTKGRRRRVVKLTTRAAEAIDGLPRIGPYLFANPETKKPWCNATLWNWWREAADGAGLKPAPGDTSVRWHDLRGSCGSRLVSEGAKITAVQTIMGHQHLSTTALYIRVAPADVAEAYQMLENATRKPPQRAPGAREEVDRADKKATGP